MLAALSISSLIVHAWSRSSVAHSYAAGVGITFENILHEHESRRRAVVDLTHPNFGVLFGIALILSQVEKHTIFDDVTNLGLRRCR